MWPICELNTLEIPQVPILLKRLWNIISPGKYASGDVTEEEPSTSRNTATTGENNGNSHDRKNGQSKTSQKRKQANNDQDGKDKLRKLDNERLDSERSTSSSRSVGKEDVGSDSEAVAGDSNTSFSYFTDNMISARSASELAGTDISNSSW